MNLEEIKNRIENIEPYINGFEDMKRASVIVPLVEIEGETCIIFEVRSKVLKSQPGDICFPGGKIDHNETPKAAALREIYEELNLDSIEIIKELDTAIRLDGMIIHPFLGNIKSIDNLKVSEDEVDHIIYIPLSYLLEQEPLEVTTKVELKRGKDFPYELIVDGANYKFRDGEVKVLFYKYKDYVIWGVTASILKSFLRKI